MKLRTIAPAAGLAVLCAAAVCAGDFPLYVFDDGLDHGGLSLQKQVELTIHGVRADLQGLARTVIIQRR